VPCFCGGEKKFATARFLSLDRRIACNIRRKSMLAGIYFQKKTAPGVWDTRRRFVGKEGQIVRGVLSPSGPKKTGVVERPKAIIYAGLLSNGRPGNSGQPFISSACLGIPSRMNLDSNSVLLI
jgi:hypothetical protein